MALGDEFVKAPNLDNPYVSPEEQGMDMVPHVMGPPAYGSPDPNTSAATLVPIVDHPLTDEIADDYGADALEAAEAAAEGDEEGDNATAGAVTLAEAEGVDLADVEGTGAGGRVTKADVENFIASRDS